MLTKELSYLDFDDKPVTETLYFNLTEAELIELEIGEGESGLQEHLRKIVAESDRKQMWKWFKDIVLMAYGQRSEDKRLFIKNEKLKEEFSHSAAFNALMSLLVTDSNFAADFTIGILPKRITDNNDIKAKMAEALGTKEQTTIEAPKESVPAGVEAPKPPPTT
jgi:hypothetical protein